MKVEDQHKLLKFVELLTGLQPSILVVLECYVYHLYYTTVFNNNREEHWL